MEKLRKKGFIQVAEWIIASFIIIFILLVFSIVSSMLIFSKTIQKSLSPSEPEFKQEGFVDIISEKSFENFARLELEISSRKIKVFEIIANASSQDDEKAKLFREKAPRFLNFVMQDKYSGSWIGVFNGQDEMYKNYYVENGDCNINDKNSIAYYLFFANNKIVLCLRAK